VVDDEAVSLVQGSGPVVDDERPEPQAVRATFLGELDQA
jgi:hypothetical protein